MSRTDLQPPLGEARDARQSGALPADRRPPPGLVLRRATPADTDAIQQQWFDTRWAVAGDSPVARELELFEAWVAEIAGEIVAGAFAVPFDQVVGGTTYPMAGIRGVTCAVHMRRRGVVDRLLRHALHDVRRRYELSALWPFSPPFYERYEFGVCGHHVRWRLLIEDLDLPGPPVPPRRLTHDDIPALGRLVETELETIGNGAVLPPRYFLERHYFPRREADVDPTTLGFFDDGGELLAVVSWNAQTGAGEEKNRIWARFWHGVDAAWRARALGWLRSLRDQYVEIVIDLPADDLFYHHIRRPYRWDSTIRREGFREPSATFSPEWQARFLEPGKALSRPRTLHGQGGTLVVELTDSVFPDLNGSFLWTISHDDPGWCALRDPADAAGLPRIKLSMGDLSRIWYGAVDVHQLLRAGRATCDERAASMLHAAFGGFRCHLQHSF